jgi:hypothetical protein
MGYAAFFCDALGFIHPTSCATKENPCAEANSLCTTLPPIRQGFGHNRCLQKNDQSDEFFILIESSL